MLVSVTILRGHYLFGKLTPQHIDRLSACIVTKTVKRGTNIFAKGDPGTSLCAIGEGTVKISVSTVDGKDAVFNVLRKGAIFGEIALLDGNPRTADAIAATDCELFVIERRDFLPLMGEEPDIALRIIEILCSRLRRTTEQAEEVMSLDLPSRLAKALMRLVDADTVGMRERKVLLARSRCNAPVALRLKLFVRLEADRRCRLFVRRRRCILVQNHGGVAAR